MAPAVIAAVIIAALCFSSAAKLPDSFERCQRKDPKLNECLKSAMQKSLKDMKSGVDSLQMLPLDPLAVTTVVIQEGAGRPVNMKLDLKNVKVHGLSDGVIENVRADLDKRVLEITGYLPYAYLESDYEMDGKFLVLPIKGNGKTRLDFTKLLSTLKITAEEKQKDGKSYWNIVSFETKINGMDKFQVNFENLFNGDKALGENTNKVLNENWKTFWEELRPSFEETFGEIFLQISNTLFSKVAENDIFLN